VTALVERTGIVMLIVRFDNNGFNKAVVRHFVMLSVCNFGPCDNTHRILGDGDKHQNLLSRAKLLIHRLSERGLSDWKRKQRYRKCAGLNRHFVGKARVPNQLTDDVRDHVHSGVRCRRRTASPEPAGPGYCW
jgi:hypothetical protein